MGLGGIPGELGGGQADEDDGGGGGLEGVRLGVGEIECGAAMLYSRGSVAVS